MNKRLATALAVTLCLTLASAAALAQGPHRRGPGGPGGGFEGHGFFGPRIATALGLTDDQKTQIRNIVSSQRESTKAIRDQLKPIREQEQAAVQAGKSEAELTSLANSAAPLLAQLHAAGLVTRSKIYQVLTPEQRTKLEEMRSNMHERGGQRMRQRSQQ
jgi:protein CpxP